MKIHQSKGIWYYLRKFEGLFLLLPFIVYYMVKDIPFFLRCEECKNIKFDQLYIRSGLCEYCLRQKRQSNLIHKKEIHIVEYPLPSEPPSEHYFKPRKHYYEKISRKIGEGKVLDVGCGYGYLLYCLQSKHRDMYGIDIQKQVIRMASSWVNGAKFCIADVNSSGFPFKSNTFDYLICTQVLEHIDGSNAVNECFRVLKGGGHALFIVPNGRGVAGSVFVDHVQFFSFKSITELLQGGGFEIISGQKYGLHIPFVSIFLDILSQFLGKSLMFSSELRDINVPEFLAINFLIECRKPPT